MTKGLTQCDLPSKGALASTGRMDDEDVAAIQAGRDCGLALEERPQRLHASHGQRAPSWRPRPCGHRPEILKEFTLGFCFTRDSTETVGDARARAHLTAPASRPPQTLPSTLGEPLAHLNSGSHGGLVGRRG